MNSPAFAPRPGTPEKISYQPTLPQEEFIVPLLRVQIESLLEAYAKDAVNFRALDVGCGGQPFRAHLEALGYQYTGLDVQQNPAETVDYLCEIDQPLPAALLDRGLYGWISCTEVMEHVADWDRAFRNLAQLLAPGGRLLITCPHLYQLHEEPYDFWRPTPHALTYFGQQAGLKVLTQIKAGDTWDVLGTLLGNCYATPARPGLCDRLLNKLTTWAIKGLYQWLKSRRLQASVILHSPFYLSNVVVFEQPCCP